MAGAVFITGVSRGIGRACALALADRGVDLALLGRASEAHEQTQGACAQHGVRATSHLCDMVDVESLTRAVDEALEAHGPPQAVVNNAATILHGPLLHEIAFADWDRVMAVNLRAPFVLCRSLLPSMLHAGRGRFVHIASISATVACPRAAAYGASKWGLLGLHKALSEELRGTGLQSIAVLPGSVDTDMLAATPFTPTIHPDEVAAAVVHYALDAPAAHAGAAIELFG